MLLKSFCNICAIYQYSVRSILKEDSGIIFGKDVFNILNSDGLISDLIEAGILSSAGTLSNAIKSGASQGDLWSLHETDNLYPSSGSSSSSGGSSSSNNGSSVTIPSHSETEGNLVWVPTNGGTKYHSRSSCSQMIDPIQVSIETAIANGYTACGRCH